MTEEETYRICKQYGITNYTINHDMTIDVDGSVNLSERNLTNLPLKFGKVSGEFNCNNNNLTTLEGCPHYIGGYLSCSNNILTTLQHLPMNFHIGSSFWCIDNKITESKEYGKLLFGTINGEIFTNDVKLEDFLNNNKNPPKKDLPRLLSELRKIQL